MTYQQLFEKLQKELAEKADVYLRMEKEVAQVKGFGDMGDLMEYRKAKGEWQVASNNYWGFLANIRGRDINPNDEVSI